MALRKHLILSTTVFRSLELSSSLTIRSQVINYGKSITDYYNSMSENLKRFRKSVILRSEHGR